MLITQALVMAGNPPVATDTKMARADHALTLRNANCYMYLVDATAAHTTSTGALPGALKHHQSVLGEERANYRLGIIEMVEAIQPPTVLKKVKEKNSTCELIVTLVNLQEVMHNVPFSADFVAGVVTHRGELAGELFDQIQNCTGRYEQHHKH